MTGPDQGSKAVDFREGENDNLQASQYQQVERVKPYVARVLSYLVLEPAGRPLDEFHDNTELLTALRDAIEAHRSLLIQGSILHRDISSNNIIITDPKQADGYRGVLIDLDLATTVDNAFNDRRTNAQQITGTLKYMALEILETCQKGLPDMEHTYRHDLESFLYVFLDICTNHGRDSKKPDPFRNWYAGGYKEIVLSKTGHLEVGSFQMQVLDEFMPKFKDLKPVATKMRNALFTTGPLFKETPQQHPSMLYDEIIAAFNDTLH